jgi:hypothetical protein
MWAHTEPYHIVNIELRFFIAPRPGKPNFAKMRAFAYKFDCPVGVWARYLLLLLLHCPFLCLC